MTNATWNTNTEADTPAMPAAIHSSALLWKGDKLIRLPRIQQTPAAATCEAAKRKWTPTQANTLCMVGKYIRGIR